MPTLESSGASTSVGGGEEVLLGESYPVLTDEGRERRATVLDRRDDEDGGGVQYYVHYDGEDKRLDCWVEASRLRGKKRRKGDKSGVEGEPRARRLRKMKQREHSPHVSNRNGGGEGGGAMEQHIGDMLQQQHEQLTRVKNVECVRVGEWELDAWYYSPYPDEYARLKMLYVCEYCLLYTRTEKAARAHAHDCAAHRPPGKEIYREGALSVLEVDGVHDKLFSQCLCLFAKLFLDHKTIYFDVAGFLFYVLCETDADGTRPIGYFSKEKGSPNGHNLNCILVFPPYQRHGYGKLLIQLSYELSRREGIIGGPEKPLSDLGLLGYRSFWAWQICDVLVVGLDRSVTSVEQLSRETGIAAADVAETLEWLGVAAAPRIDGSILVRMQQIEEMRRGPARPPRCQLNARILRWRPASQQL